MSQHNSVPLESEGAPSSVILNIDVARWIPGANRVEISAPVEVTCFSRHADRTISYGSRSELASFRAPELGVDLTKGIDKYIEKRKNDDEAPGVEPVLRALMNSEFDIKTSANIVTARNNLNKIARTPYIKNDSWEVDATCVSEESSELTFLEKVDDKRVPNSGQKRFMYMGCYFEKLCTGAAEEAVDANVEFCSVLLTHLGTHKIVLAAEIDCEENGNYKELKTTRVARHQGDLDSLYLYRFLRYWIQSHLAGVPQVVIGMRDNSGTLKSVTTYNTNDLPRIARENVSPYRVAWDEQTILDFLHFVLSHIRRICRNNRDKTIRVQYVPNEKRIVMYVLEGSSFSQRMKQELGQVHK